MNEDKLGEELKKLIYSHDGKVAIREAVQNTIKAKEDLDVATRVNLRNMYTHMDI